MPLRSDFPAPPKDLGHVGLELWKHLWADGVYDAAGRMLAGQICRLADRCERYATILADDGYTWLEIREDRGDPSKMVLVINSVAAEERQATMALKSALAELRNTREGSGPVNHSREGKRETRDVLAKIAESIAAKQAAAQD